MPLPVEAVGTRATMIHPFHYVKLGSMRGRVNVGGTWRDWERTRRKGMEGKEGEGRGSEGKGRRVNGGGCGRVWEL